MDNTEMIFKSGVICSCRHWTYMIRIEDNSMMNMSDEIFPHEFSTGFGIVSGFADLYGMRSGVDGSGTSSGYGNKYSEGIGCGY